jgi:hypothetical protein
MRRIASALAVVLLALGCASEPEPVPPPPWLTPSRLPDGPARRDAPRTPNVEGETVTVEATGEGITEEAAKKDALRNALEQGAGAIIRSQSLTVDWRLARDVVLAETQGSIVKFDLLDLRKAGAVHRAKVRAVVSTQLIGKDLSILHYLSNHARIACAVVDVVDGRPTGTALAQSSFERALLEKKFNVVDLSQVEKIAARDRLRSFEDPAAAQRLGKRWDCDILIAGRGSTAFAKTEAVYGVPQHFYAAGIEARAVLVSSGKVIASDNVTVRRGARSRPAAQTRALAGAGAELADSLIPKIVLHLRKTSVDEQTIQLLVTGVTYEKLLELEAALRKMRGVQKLVQRSFRDGSAVLDCTFRGDAPALAALIGRLEQPAVRVDAVDRNRVELHTPKR